jgi:hypothetical protein
LAASIDGEALHLLTGRAGDVLTNLRRISTAVKVASPGARKPSVWMVDPGAVLDRLVLDFAAPKDSYLEPREWYRC